VVQPATSNCAIRDAQHGGHFGLGHAGEVPQLDDVGGPRIDGGELLERFVDADDQIFVARVCDRQIGDQRQARLASAAALGAAAARDVDDHRPHDLGRPAAEVEAVGELQAAGSGEPEVRLLDQGSGVERRRARMAAQPRAGEFPQQRIALFEERLSRRGVALLRPLEESGQLDRGHEAGPASHSTWMLSAPIVAVQAGALRQASRLRLFRPRGAARCPRS
jgi:hypothetical protein